MLVKELQEAFIKKVDKKKLKEKDKSKKVLDKQFKTVSNMLKENARNGIPQVRLSTSTVHPKLVDRLKEEGLIVWKNSVSILIRIPLDNITYE